MRWGLWASLYASVNQKNGGGDKMRKSFWLISAGMAALAAPSFAQEPVSPVGEATPTQEAASVDEVVQDEGGAQDTDDIIVTATRRNEALSDVPLAVSAVTGQALENSGAADIRQLQQLSPRSEEHTSELQSLMRISYAVFCLKNKTTK